MTVMMPNAEADRPLLSLCFRNPLPPGGFHPLPLGGLVVESHADTGDEQGDILDQPKGPAGPGG
ncbi:hypothetical protein [Streptomyces sp. NPDC048312]|uniref:hypothetical protein n=1 Tax=Streptomyces sp. NPDC048312 TaxID=3155485 RepID=UPI0034076C43